MGIPGPIQVAFYLITPIILFYGSVMFANRVRNWERARPTIGAPHPRTSSAACGDFRAGVYMKTLLRDPAAGSCTRMIYFGFLILLGVTTTLEVDHQMPEGQVPPWPVYQATLRRRPAG